MVETQRYPTTLAMTVTKTQQSARNYSPTPSLSYHYTVQNYKVVSGDNEVVQPKAHGPTTPNTTHSLVREETINNPPAHYCEYHHGTKEATITASEPLRA